MKNIFLILFTSFFVFGCVVDQGKIAVDIKRKVKEATGSTSNPSNLSSASVSNVRIINNQLVITGSGLNSVTTVKVNGNSLNQNFTIETISASQIVANAVNAFSFDVSKVFDLVLSNANAAATFPIDFSLCNATLNGKAFNCAVTANDKDVLSFDAVTNKWKPRSINGLTFQGGWDAHDPEPAGASAGDYYIVSVANSPYAVGDWIVWNGTGYDKISNSTTITSVFGRTGAIVATKGDYDLNKLTDIDLTVAPVAGKVLKYNGTKWVAADDLSGGGAGSVTTAEIAAGAVTDAKIDTVSASKITGTITSAQIADGTIVNADISATAAIDYSKLNIPNGSIPYAKLNIADGDIPAAKISGLPAATSILTTTITNNDTTHAPDGNAVYDALATKLNTTGGTLTVGTITGVPTPVNPGDVASKSYVDATIASAVPTLDTDNVTEGSQLYFTEPRVRATALTGLNTGVAGPIAATDTVLSAAGKLQYQITDLKANGQWTKTGNDIAYSAGNVTIDKHLILKDTGSNYVEIKAPSTVTTSYTLTLPPTAGSNNYVLKTDGAGVLSWVAVNDASVQAFAKTTLPTCSTGEVLKSNGTTISCVTDATGAGSFTGAASRAVATDSGGALTTSTTTSTELGYVSGVTSAIQTQLNAKEATIAAGTSTQYYKGDKTWATLDTTAVAEGSNLYFTTARAKAAAVADSIADAITDVAPSQNAVYDALANKLSTTGGTLTVGTISGVPTPTNPSDVANKSYVDAAIAAATPTLSTTDVTEGANLYFTDTRVRGTALTGLNTGVNGPITAADTVLSATGKLQYQITDLKAYGQWIKTGNDLYYSAGDVTVEKNFKLQDGASNFVLFKAPATVTTTYTLTMPAAKATVAGQALTSDTSGALSWTTISDASVQAFAKSVLPTCSTGEVLKSNGTSFSCVTDSTGAGAFIGSASRAVATDSGGALTSSTTTAAELGYVAGVTSSIQSQLDAKQTAIAAGTTSQYYRGDKSWATLDTSVVTENTNLYFTAARAKSATIADSIADSITDVAPSQNAVFDALAAKLSTTGGTLTIGTISGVPTPTNPSDVANKAYVDSLSSTVTGLTTSSVAEGSNYYFTEARVRATALTGLNTGVNGPITATDTVLSAAGKLQYQITDLKTFGQWTKTGNDLSYSAGDVTIDKTLILKDSSTNTISIKAPASVTTYTLTLPATAGSSNQVLTTNGSGTLSWTSLATSAAPSGTAGGDLSGSYPNPTISALAATKIGGGTVDNTEFNYLDGVTSSIQTQLTGKQSSDATLTALAAYNTNGLLVQTAADTFAGRTIAGTANRVSVTNGDGVAGNPTLNIDTTLLPSPAAGDSGKFLKATGANASAWTSMGSSDVTTALGFTPVNKAGDTISSGTMTFNGAGILSVPTPVNLTDAVNKSYVDGFGQWTKGTGGNSGDLYRSTGLIGLGTSTPSYLMDLNSTSGTSIPLRLKTNTNGVSSSIRFDALDSGAANQVGYVGLVPATGTNMSRVVLSNSAGTELISARSDGNVGIGTTAPTSKLTVNGTIESSSGGMKFPDGSIQTSAYADNVTDISAGLATNCPMAYDFGANYSAGTGYTCYIDTNGLFNSTNGGNGQFAKTLRWGNVYGYKTSFAIEDSADNSSWTTLIASTNSGSYNLPSTTRRYLRFRSVDSDGFANLSAVSLLGGPTNIGYGAYPTGWFMREAWRTASGNVFIGPGNVGIGTGTPSPHQHGGSNKVLTIHNSGTGQHSQSHLIVSSASTGASSSIGSITAALPNSSATNKGVAYIGFASGPNSTAASPTAEIVMATRGAGDSNWTNRLFITESGNVGVGTVAGAPLQRFQVQGIAGSQTLLQVNNSDFSNSGSTGSGAYIGTYTASGNGASMVQAFKAGNTVASELLLNPFSGTVGINTPTPSTVYNLDVNGGARINSIKGGQINGAGNFHVDSSGSGAFYVNWSAGSGGLYVGNGTNGGYAAVYASAFNVSSDKTLKKNIVNIENPLDIILNINGVKFDWVNEKEDSSRQVGVIAQDVQKVLPEVVTTNKQTKKLTVNYSALVAPLIEAVKELYHKWFDDSVEVHRKIASVDTKVAKLEAENAALKARTIKAEQENAAIKLRLEKIEKMLQNK